MPIEKQLIRKIQTINNIKTAVVRYGNYELNIINKKGKPFIESSKPSNFGIVEKDLYRAMFRAGSACLGNSVVKTTNALNKDKRFAKTFWVSAYEENQIKKLITELRKAH